MNQASSDQPNSNPFATRHTRPGALPFLFPPDWNIARLVSQLQRHDWWGAIVGPHGSGKSTLLAALQPALQDVGREVGFYVLHAGERKLPPSRAPLTWTRVTQVVVDGYEQLSRWSRYQLRRNCRRAGAGLLVTSHRIVPRIPTLFTTHSDLQLATSLARQLLGSHTIPAVDLERLFHQTGGNMRELWFQLYDVFEEQQG